MNAFENISPPINPLDFDLLSSGVSFVSEYETHPKTLSPVDGIRIHLSYMQNLEIIGSDRDFGELKFFTHYYLPVTKWWVPAFRVESMLATGEPPFYAKPYVRLRGVPVLRYQGEFVATVETEQLFNVTHRWGLVAFAGAGAGFNNLEQFEKGPTAWSAGGGFRYLLARAFGLRMGIDVAKGPEDLEVIVEIAPGRLRHFDQTPSDITNLMSRYGFHAYELKNNYAIAGNFPPRKIRRPQRLEGPIVKIVDVIFSRIDAAEL